MRLPWQSDDTISIDADAIYTDGPDLNDTKAPPGPIENRWDERKFNANYASTRQPPQAERDHRRHRSGRGLGGGDAG